MQLEQTAGSFFLQAGRGKRRWGNPGGGGESPYNTDRTPSSLAQFVFGCGKRNTPLHVSSRPGRVGSKPSTTQLSYIWWWCDTAYNSGGGG